MWQRADSIYIETFEIIQKRHHIDQFHLILLRSYLDSLFSEIARGDDDPAMRPLALNCVQETLDGHHVDGAVDRFKYAEREVFAADHRGLIKHINFKFTVVGPDRVTVFQIKFSEEIETFIAKLRSIKQVNWLVFWIVPDNLFLRWRRGIIFQEKDKDQSQKDGSNWDEENFHYLIISS